MAEKEKLSEDRLEVLKKICKFEKEGLWDQDVENDLEATELFPNQVDYLNKKLSSKIKTAIANSLATKFFEGLIKKKQIIIKEINGIENYLSVKTGAIITSNHFSPFENYAVWRSIKPYMGRKRLWRVIKEGNYTAPPPPFKFFMQNCNTLPLSRNKETMRNFMRAVDMLLKRGEKILVYPEQAMWWNYKKPRPFKNGAFRFAVNAGVPVIPFFITMQDSDIVAGDGSFVQEWTVNILPAIYPDENLAKNENIEQMRQKNYECWVYTYENFYKKALKYDTKEK